VKGYSNASNFWGLIGFAVLGLLMAAWEGYSYQHATRGPTVHATVQDCTIDANGRGVTTCTGTWTVAGHAEHGHVVNVDVEDIGRRVSAHLHGHSAYVRAHTANMIVFFFIGVAIAGACVFFAFRKFWPL
jgi:hypothetical protein